jgi:hypothetical protein
MFTQNCLIIAMFFHSSPQTKARPFPRWWVTPTGSRASYRRGLFFEEELITVRRGISGRHRWQCQRRCKGRKDHPFDILLAE